MVFKKLKICGNIEMGTIKLSKEQIQAIENELSKNGRVEVLSTDGKTVKIMRVKREKLNIPVSNR